MDEHREQGQEHERSGRGSMGRRGVTRPMGDHGDGKEGGEEKGHDGGHAMGREERGRMLAMHHAQTQWVCWTLALLGVWTALSPLTFGYGSDLVQPAGGRDLWLSDAARVWSMTASDLVSGALLLVFGLRSLKPNRPVSLWICAGVGAWLTLAPVLLWAPDAAAYVNATLVGMLVLSLSILIPGMPNMIAFMKMGPATPPGWSYNPSSWPQRAVMIGLAFAGFLASRYLAAYQLGYIDTIWDPFFGDSTARVLTSEMSRSLFVSDAALGTAAYTFEFLMGFMGSPARWRTMPWMVAFYGILVIPLGLVHILLVVSQPVVVGAWCTFCLLAAAIMLPMLPLEGDEVVAMLQHMRRAKRRGDSLWRVFWKGGSPEGSTPDERTPPMSEAPDRPGALLRASVWGMSVPWTLAGAAALGLALMATPGVLGVAKPASDVFHLGGALVVTVSVVAMGEVFRLARLVNLALGLVVAVVPWLLAGAGTGARLVGLAAGLLVAALSLPRGRVRERYGNWDRLVR